MSTQYTQTELTAKKVADLKAILSDLGLPTTGVKAELVSRILEHQDSNDTGAEKDTDLPAAGNALGAIPSETELPASKAAAESGATGTASNGQQTGTAEGQTQPSQSEAKTDAKVEKQADGIALPELPGGTDKMSEVEKRKQRLMRFGNKEELAKLERAEKFGTAGTDAVDDKAVSRLDSELSNKRMKKDAAGNAAKGSGAGQKPAAPQKAAATNGNKPASKNANKPVSKGAPKPASAAKKVDPEEEERKRKRAERFGAPAK